MKNIKDKIIKVAKTKIERDAVGEYAEFYIEDLEDLFSLQKQEIVEDIEKEIQQIEKDGLSIGLERQS